jgi:hypothetical protein
LLSLGNNKVKCSIAWVVSRMVSFQSWWRASMWNRALTLPIETDLMPLSVSIHAGIEMTYRVSKSEMVLPREKSGKCLDTHEGPLKKWQNIKYPWSHGPTRSFNRQTDHLAMLSSRRQQPLLITIPWWLRPHPMEKRGRGNMQASYC